MLVTSSKIGVSLEQWDTNKSWYSFAAPIQPSDISIPRVMCITEKASSQKHSAGLHESIQYMTVDLQKP